MNDLISKLSEIRSEYNCFDEDEEPYYRALSEAIKILSQCADEDTISRQAAIDALNDYLIGKRCFDNGTMMAQFIERNVLRKLPPAQPEEDCDTCKHGYFGDTCCNNCKVRFPSHYERRTDEE